MSLSVSTTRPRATPAVELSPAVEVAALLVITLCGLGVRLQGLTSYGIWFDEAYHIALVQLPDVPRMLDAVLSNPPSDPLYVLLLRGWVGLFGHGDEAVRMLSVIFSAATVPATYFLGRITVGRTVGLLAALLFALSPYAVELGQEAALYSLAALTTTLALALGWRWLAAGRGMAAYVAAGVVAIYSHYVVAAILVVFALLAMPARGAAAPVTRRRWLTANGLIVLAWVPWLAALGVHWLGTDVPRITLRHIAQWGDVYEALVQYTSGTAALRSGPAWLRLLGLAAGAVLIVLGVWRGGRVVRVLAGVSGIIMALPVAVSAFTGWWLFVPHFMLFLFPALAVVLAAGALSIVDARQLKATGAVLAVAVLVGWHVAQVAGLSLYYGHPPHGNDGLRELASALRAGHGQGEPVFVTPPALQPSLRQYYPGETRGLPSDFDLREVYLPYEPDRWNSDSLAALDAGAGGQPGFWLIYRPELDAGGAFLRAVQARYRQVHAEQYGFGTLYRFER